MIQNDASRDGSFFWMARNVERIWWVIGFFLRDDERNCPAADTGCQVLGTLQITLKMPVVETLVLGRRGTFRKRRSYNSVFLLPLRG